MFLRSWGDCWMSKTVYLENVCDILDSQRVPVTAKDRNKGIYPYYGANGVQDYVDDYIFDDELVLLAEDGGNFGSTDKSIAYRVSGKCWVNNHAHVLKAKECIDVDYLCYSLMFYDVSSIVNGATRQKLNQAVMRKMIIPLPDINEQHKIVSKLDKVTHTIDICNSILEKLDLLVKSQFVEMFGDAKNTVPLSFYINSLSAGKSLAGEEECKNKVLKTGAVSYDHFDETQIKNLPTEYTPLKEHIVKSGDVIISRMNTAELVGAAAYVWKVSENTYLPDRLWRAEINANANPIFVWQVLIQQTTKDEIRKLAGGTSGSMKNISKPGLLGINVAKVPLELQEQFADFVKQIDKSKLAVKKTLEKAETLKKALMQEYFG